MTPPDGRGTSLILSGGGSYSAYEVGVMTALFQGLSPATGYIPLDPELLVGTSAGAMNASVVCAHEVRTGSLLSAVEELRAIWIDRIADGAARCGNGVYRIRGLPYSVFDPYCRSRGLSPFLEETVEDISLFLSGSWNAASRLLTSPESPLKTIARIINFSALISTTPFVESLQSFLPLEDLARSTRRLRIVAMDLTAGHLTVFTQDDIRRLGYEPLRASAALPIFFPPRRIDGHDYVNGTTLASTPLLPAITESDTMHLVYMDPDIRNISRIRLENIVDALDRVMVVNFAYMLNRDIRLAREINTALELIEEGVTVESLSPQDLHALLRSLARIQRRNEEGNPYRSLTIHRYHPRDDLGSDLGLMNLARQRIIDIIDRGYRDTVAHDCEASGCVLPLKPQPAIERRDARARATIAAGAKAVVRPFETPPVHR